MKVEEPGDEVQVEDLQHLLIYGLFNDAVRSSEIYNFICGFVWV
jgi:hypothetical protein